MDMYKLATRKMLRFETSRGPLPTEQLWTLKLAELEQVIRALNERLNKSASTDERLAFLSETPKVENDDDLRFMILKDIYTTRVEENNAAKAERENKLKKEQILELIARKKNAELEGKSIEELEALAEKL